MKKTQSFTFNFKIGDLIPYSFIRDPRVSKLACEPKYFSFSGTAVFSLFMEFVFGPDKTDIQTDFEDIMISCGLLAQVCVNLFFSVGVLGKFKGPIKLSLRD